MEETKNQGELEINSTQELNEQLGKLTNDPSLNKPSEEEIEAAKKEFEDAAKAFGGKMYQIGETEDAQKFYDYIIHFIRNRFMWKKDEWMGIIKLVEEIEASEVLFKGKKDKGFEIGYQALEFVYYALTNPGGIGLQSAKDFEAEKELYVTVATEVGKQLEGARNTLKDIEFLQQKWGAAAQGFYLEMEPEEKEDEKEEVEQPNDN